MAKRKRDPQVVALDYVLLEMGWDSAEVYGKQVDPSQPYMAVWIKGRVDGEQSTIGLLVHTGIMRVEDEFDVDEVEPGQLKSGNADPLGGPMFIS